MTRRSTIGINPLDVDFPNPLESTIPDQCGGTEKRPHQEGKKQGSVSPSAGEHPVTISILHAKNNPAQKPSASQEGGTKEKLRIHQKNVAQPGQAKLEVLSPSDEHAKRLSELEQENLCLKWALGFILVPLALLAFLG